jgi:hypothetical protein
MAQRQNAANTQLAVVFIESQLQPTCPGTGGFLKQVGFKVGTRLGGGSALNTATPSAPTALL